MSRFGIDDLCENVNVFDRKAPRAVVRSRRTRKTSKSGTRTIYSDVLCHGEGWAVRGIGESKSDELVHWGIKGQKWGVRRWQNEDGSLTEEGKKRYNAGYWHGQKIAETDNLKGRALIGLGLKGALKYGKYVREKDKKTFEAKYGKTKEEQKKNIDKEWDEMTRKENAQMALGKKMDAFDKNKLSSQEQDDVMKEVKSEIDRLNAKMDKDGGLNHDDDNARDGLLDWWNQTNKKRYQEGKQNAEEDFKAVESITDPQEKASKLEKMLGDAHKALGPYADSTYPGYDENEDAKQQAYNIKMCSMLDRKIKGICDPLGLLGNGTEGHTPGTKAITDRMNKNVEEQDALYKEYVKNYKEKHKIASDKALSAREFMKMLSGYENGKVYQLKKEYANMEHTELREQILKDLGLPVTSQNMANIYPFVYYDSFIVD